MFREEMGAEEEFGPIEVGVDVRSRDLEVKEGIDKMETMPTLTPRAMMIMDYYLQGLKPGQIAERLDLASSYVSLIINAPNFQHQLALRRGGITERVDEEIVRSEKEAVDVLRENAKKAAERMAHLIDSPRESIQLRAAADVLDRTGHGKPQRSQVEQSRSILVLDDKAAMLIQETLRMEGDDGKD